MLEDLNVLHFRMFSDNDLPWNDRGEPDMFVPGNAKHVDAPHGWKTCIAVNPLVSRFSQNTLQLLASETRRLQSETAYSDRGKGRRKGVPRNSYVLRTVLHWSSDHASSK